MMVGDLIPRRTARVVLCDEGDADLARRAAARLERFGYRDVSVLAGGVRAWKEAGYEVFSGVNVPSKAFGEYVEHRYGTPHITASELAERMKQGNHVRLIDVREPHELQISQLEGATLIPLGQMAARLSELDSAEEIVLFCKSGTRSARALELLASAGFRKVKNLKGGINAWAREVDSSLPIY